MTNPPIPVTYPEYRECLSSTAFLDHENPAVKDLVHTVAPESLSERERAITLFEYVRDGITFEFFPRFYPEEFRASRILQEGGGFCGRKCVALTTLFRGAGLPACCVFTDLHDQSISPRVGKILGTTVLPYHGLSAVYLDGRWFQVDATFSAGVVEKKGYRQVIFDGAGDAALPSDDLKGRPHASYLNPHGAYPDLPIDEMLAAYKAWFANADRAGMEELFGGRLPFTPPA